MATLPSSDDKVRMVLDMYQLLGTKPSEVLHIRNFVAIAANRDWRMADIADGLEQACDLGWLEELPGGSYRLTDAGFAKI